MPQTTTDTDKSGNPVVIHDAKTGQLDPEALLARVQELESQVKDKDAAPNYQVDDATDDRNELVTITYGATLREYQTVTMTKRAAVEFLYNQYAFKAPTGRNVPKFGEGGFPLNDAPCYVKIRRRDGFSKQIVDYYKDMPLWILVDRMINHPQTYLNVQLVRKEEWLADQQKSRQEQHDEVSQVAARQKKLEAAADLILSKS